eukprot:scaffold4648_cov295-Prasinococcus_capsulatus_cf.AAC.1
MEARHRSGTRLLSSRIQLVARANKRAERVHDLALGFRAPAPLARANGNALSAVLAAYRRAGPC